MDSFNAENLKITTKLRRSGIPLLQKNKK